MYYVYIIESEKSGIFYKGSTSNYQLRLFQYNEGINTYTKEKGPWKLNFIREYETKTEALAEERRLKRCNKTYLQWLIKQPVNKLNNNKL